VECVPPSGTCNDRGSQGAWRLAARVARQTVWKRVSLGGSRVTPNDIAKAEIVFDCF